MLKSIKEVEGFIAGKEMPDKGLTFWTVTIWESEAAMKYFRNNDPHKSAMRLLSDWCDEAAYAHWLQQESEIYDWDILHQRLVAEGKLTKVKRPSKNQATLNYPPPAWKKLGQLF